MPSRVANGAASPRFELPALNLNFGSITDGTDIPPPPASPVQKVATPPRTPTKIEKEATAKDAEKPAATATNGKIAGTKRPAEGPPASPAGSGRQGSLRRLFSRNMLNNSYAEGEKMKSTGDGSVSAAAATLERPASRSTSHASDKQAKRSSGWFRRLRTGESNKRTSLLSEQMTAPTSPLKPSGPPPPMIPELKDLEKDEGSLGNDLFKNI